MDEKIFKTLNYYDGIAKGYKELYHNEQKQKILHIISYLPKNGRILDLGSGDGVFNEFVSSKVDLISVDLSFELLKLNNNFNNRINASILKLPFKSNYFEFIVSFSVLQDLPDVETGVCEIYRVLKKDGILIVSFLHMSLKSQNLLNLIEERFELIEKIKEEKDWILVVKKK